MNTYIVRINDTAAPKNLEGLKKIIPNTVRDNALKFLNEHGISKSSNTYLDKLSRYYSLATDDELSEKQITVLKTQYGADLIYKYIAPEPDTKSITQITLANQSTQKNSKSIGDFTPENNPFFSEERQIYANPFGIDALYSWSVPGGDGSNASVYVMDDGIDDVADFEGTINILENKKALSHGTAVMGIIKMQDNNIAGIGISPKSTAYFHYVPGGVEVNAPVLLKSLEYLEPGDVINFSYQREGLPLILDPLYFDTIKTLTEAGIVFVLIAGNGTNNLDEVKNEEGKYILNVNSADYSDSGAIIVGGCLPEFDLPRALNYGSIIDTMAFCEDALTVNSGNGGIRFGGTSAAAPIISGVVVNIQSASKAAGRPPLNSKEIRALLRDHKNGQSSSTIYPNEHVSLPSLRKIFNTLGLPAGGYDGNYAVKPNVLSEMQKKVDDLFTDKEHTTLLDTVNAATINAAEIYLNNTPYCDLKRTLLSEIKNAYKLVFENAEELFPASKLLEIENWSFSGEKSVTSGPEGLDLTYADDSVHLGISYNQKLEFQKGKRYRITLGYKALTGDLGTATLKFGAVSIDDGTIINSEIFSTQQFGITYRTKIDQSIFLDFIPVQDIVTTGVPALYFSYFFAEITLRITSISIISY